MATLRDYIVVNNGTFALNPGESETFSDPIPSNLVIGTNRAKPIIMFKAWATPSGGSFGQRPFHLRADHGGGRRARAVGDVLGRGAQPRYRQHSAVRATENKIWFSDVVLCFQVQA